MIFGRGCGVYNPTFNNISAISWQSALLMEETGVPEENHRPAANHWQTVSHNIVSSTPRLSGVRTHKIGNPNTIRARRPRDIWKYNDNWTLVYLYNELDKIWTEASSSVASMVVTNLVTVNNSNNINKVKNQHVLWTGVNCRDIIRGWSDHSR